MNATTKRYIPSVFDAKIKLAFDIKSKEHGEINVGIVDCEDGGYKAFVMKENKELSEYSDMSYKNVIAKVYELGDSVKGSVKFANIAGYNANVGK